MIRRLNNISTYKIGDQIVILKSIRNDVSGNPRFKALIPNGDQTYVYTFKGHYCGDKEEAEYILEYHNKVIGRA